MEKQDTGDSSMEQKILAAAELLFLEKGLALTSTTEIAKEAGCNQALVHYYFRTKDRLFEMIFEKKAELFMKTFLQISGELLPFEEKLRRKVAAHYEMLLANPQLPFLIINELVTNPQRLQGLKEKLSSVVGSVYREFEAELAEEIRKGTVRPLSVADIIITIISLNVYPFLGAPVLKVAMGLDAAGLQERLRMRKQENVEIVLRSLRP
jgi:Transcriptional regulator